MKDVRGERRDFEVFRRRPRLCPEHHRRSERTASNGATTYGKIRQTFVKVDNYPCRTLTASSKVGRRNWPARRQGLPEYPVSV